MSKPCLALGSDSQPPGQPSGETRGVYGSATNCWRESNPSRLNHQSEWPMRAGIVIAC